MYKNTKHIIKAISIILVVYGAVELLLGAQSIWWGITSLFYSSNVTFLSMLYIIGIPVFFNFMIPVSIILGSIGLLKQKKWGWIVSIIVSLLVFIMNFAGTINFAIASYFYFYKNIPLPTIPEGAHVEYYSMIPTYITTCISLAYIFFLNQKHVKSIFVN